MALQKRQVIKKIVSDMKAYDELEKEALSFIQNLADIGIESFDSEAFKLFCEEFFENRDKGLGVKSGALHPQKRDTKLVVNDILAKKIRIDERK